MITFEWYSVSNSTQLVITIRAGVYFIVALVCRQVTVLRSYDIMIATARRQPEGSLIYVVDKADLYLRVRYGLRQVMVAIHFFLPRQ